MFENKKIFVLGMGRSGISVARLLANKNEVVITDIKNDNENDVEDLEKIGVKVIITEDQASIFDNSFDAVIKNPGIKLDHPVVLKALEFNIPILTELEVAYRYLPDVKIVGITGSNGKTTTTTITYEILKEAGLPVYLAGNIGIPLCSMLSNIKDGDILTLEISSHQLINFDQFKADIAVLTNLSPVHLDHFGTYEKYKMNKLTIFNHQTDSDLAIVNKGDSEVYELSKGLKAQKLYFSSKGKADIYIDNEYIVYGDSKFKLSDIKLRGIHNYENVMVAILIAKSFDVSDEVIKKVLGEFKGVAHRIEFVRTLNGRDFYNDSKSTNVTSTITALKSFNNDVVLILGGLDRGHSFDDLVPYLSHTKHIVCYGETKDRIKEFATKNNIDVSVVDNVSEAAKEAYSVSKEGDTILLSPACASWDQFKNFELRGDEFKKTVKNL